MATTIRIVERRMRRPEDTSSKKRPEKSCVAKTPSERTELISHVRADADPIFDFHRRLHFRFSRLNPSCAEMRIPQVTRISHLRFAQRFWRTENKERWSLYDILRIQQRGFPLRFTTTQSLSSKAPYESGRASTQLYYMWGSDLNLIRTNPILIPHAIRRNQKN